MGLAGARPANEHHVLRRVHKLQRGKLVDLALVQILGRLQGEVKPGQIAMNRKPGVDADVKLTQSADLL